MREQTSPTHETARFGERFVQVQGPDKGAPEISPLPEAMKAPLNLLRAALSGGGPPPSDAYEAADKFGYVPQADGAWRLELTPSGPDAPPLSIGGCGDKLREIILHPRESGGATRRIILGGLG